jgi:hypothetical protein
MHKFTNVLMVAATAATPFASAIAKNIVAVSEARQEGDKVLFSLVSPAPFLVAGNVYVLNIANKKFAHYKQAVSNGKGVISFIIATDEYKNLPEGSKIYLTYGDLGDVQESYLETMQASENFPCWYLGTLSSEILVK